MIVIAAIAVLGVIAVTAVVSRLVQIAASLLAFLLHSSVVLAGTPAAAAVLAGLFQLPSIADTTMHCFFVIVSVAVAGTSALVAVTSFAMLAGTS